MSVNSSNFYARGFTMVELLVVVVVLGILSAVVIPRMNPTDYRSAQFHDQVVATLRYAQKTATSHRRLVCVTFTTTTVTLNIASANGAAVCNTALLLPASNSNTLTSPDTTNVVFSTLPAAFNFLPNGTTANQTISISGEANISVVGATGYVQ